MKPIVGSCNRAPGVAATIHILRAALRSPRRLLQPSRPRVSCCPTLRRCRNPGARTLSQRRVKRLRLAGPAASDAQRRIVAERIGVPIEQIRLGDRDGHVVLRLGAELWIGP